MKQLIFILLFMLTSGANAQEWLRPKNSIGLYGGLSMKGMGIKYSRIFNQKENRFSEIELGGGRGFLILKACLNAGLQFNIGKHNSYMAFGLHGTYVDIDFFGREKYHGVGISLGYRYRNKKCDFLMQVMLTEVDPKMNSLIPGINVSLGVPF